MEGVSLLKFVALRIASAFMSYKFIDLEGVFCDVAALDIYDGSLLDNLERESSKIYLSEKRCSTFR